jgi:ABC-type sugar transport system substrate-binding protein
MSVTRFVAALLALAVVAAGTWALWPASEADKARDDGETVGQAVNHLYYADSTEEVSSAVDELDAAVADTLDHRNEALGEQVSDQADALERAADGFVGSLTSDNEFDQELYEAELDYALDDLSSQAEDFRTNAPEVEQAFWEGVDSGLNAS